MKSAHAIALLLPIVVAGLVLGAVASNRSGGRGPTVLTGSDVSIGYRDDNRSIAEVRLHWSEPVGFIGEWLTPSMLESLGFDLSLDAASPEAETYYRRQLPRRAFVAFEIGGAKWEEARAQAEAARGPELGPRGVEGGPRGRPELSRLVPVAVAREPSLLEERYADPRTHLIVRALIRPMRWQRGPAFYVGGMIVSVDPARIQVPVELSAALPVRPRREFEPEPLPFTVTLMYGRRWEPWVTAVSREGASR